MNERNQKTERTTGPGRSRAGGGAFAGGGHGRRGRWPRIAAAAREKEKRGRSGSGATSGRRAFDEDGLGRLHRGRHQHDGTTRGTARRVAGGTALADTTMTMMSMTWTGAGAAGTGTASAAWAWRTACGPSLPYLPHLMPRA